jgi:hypothetical protein
VSHRRCKGSSKHRRPGLRAAIEAMLKAGCNSGEIGRVLSCSSEYARNVQSEIMPNFTPPYRDTEQVLASLAPDTRAIVEDFLARDA